MHTDLLDILRCPYCGTSLSVAENEALSRDGEEIVRAVVGCECCAYPVVDGIPYLIADDYARAAVRDLEAGRPDEALLGLLAQGDESRRERARSLVDGDVGSYREALALLCDDAEGMWFLYHLSDPTYVTADALLRAIAQAKWTFQGRTLDLCGGAGHFSRVVADTVRGNGVASEIVLADLFYWKLWLGRRFVAPSAEPVCSDANHPLPFARETFDTVLLADAFPYIWHKRLLADEMMRLTPSSGLIVMPHLHSAAGENFSAGDTLTPGAYRNLFAQRRPRLFSDERLLDDVIERRVVDLTKSVTPEALGDQPSLTLIATEREDLFRRYEVPSPRAIHGELAINPLYRIERKGDASVLTLEFPTPEYAEEFEACRRYLPDRLTLPGDLTGPVTRERVGPRFDELRERRVLLDAPPGYSSAKVRA